MRKYISTVGLQTHVNNKLKLVRVAFTLHDDTVTACVENGYTLEPLKALGKRTLSRAEFAALPDDPYNDLVFAQASFALFNLSI